MNCLNFTEEEREFRNAVRKFVEKEIIPYADEIDEKGEFPFGWFKKAGSVGYLGLRYPKKYGGEEASFTMYLILVEELAKASLSFAASVAMQCLMATDFIFRFGTEEHKQKFLVPAIKGDKVGAFCLSEPNAGSDLARIETTARQEGDFWILNGSKMWVTSGTVADFFTIAATTDKKAGLKGIKFFLAEKNCNGLSIGKKIKKLGLNASETTELFLNNCKIPKENMLGEGLKDLMSILSEIRIMTGALSVGLTSAILELAVKYSKERICFERPIAKFQAIQHKIAEIATELKAAKLLVYSDSRLIEQNKLKSDEAAMTKLFASESANKAADLLTRIMAGYGFAKEYPAQRYYRDARFLLIGGGTSEILKNIIAKEVLQM